MADWMQYLIVGFIVGLAMAYMVRLMVRRFKSRCGGCASCGPDESAKSKSTAVPLTISGRNAH